MGYRETASRKRGAESEAWRGKVEIWRGDDGKKSKKRKRIPSAMRSGRRRSPSRVASAAVLFAAAIAAAAAASLATLARADGSVRGPVQEREPVVLEHEPHVVVECELRRKGVFKVVVVPSWAPVGAERFLNLVDEGFFDGAPMFRAVRGFLVQFGLSSDPEANNRWGHLTLPDDPKQGVRIRRGTLAFAGSGKNSRTTQMFIALTDKAWPRLGSEPWETPFAYVPAEDYQAVVSLLNTKYGDIKPFNKQGVDPGKIWRHGMSYLEDGFPNLDYLAYCRRLPRHHLGFADSIMQAQEDFANAAPDDASTQLLYVLAILLAIMACYMCVSLVYRPAVKRA